MESNKNKQKEGFSRLGIYSVSAKTLLAVNIIPLIGVIFFQWSLFSIILLYWLENVVVGFFNVIRMMKAEGIPPKDIKINGRSTTTPMKGFFVIFFIIHFGIFTFVHGVFVFALFGATTESGSTIVNQGTIPWSNIAWSEVSFLGIVFALIMLLISHGISYWRNYIENEEYKKISAAEQLFKPYGRVIAMHFIILISAFVIMGLGYSLYTATVLIVIKTVIDLFTHNTEHIKLTNRDVLLGNPPINK